MSEDNNILQENTEPKPVAFCGECGLPIYDEAQGCPKCSAKSQSEPVQVETPVQTEAPVQTEEPVQPAVGAVQPEVTQQEAPKKKKVWIPIVIAVVALFLAGIIAAGVILIPILTATPQTLMAEMKYSEAYDKATDKEKHDVIAENATAHVYANGLGDMLKELKSYELTKIYFKEDTSVLVLKTTNKDDSSIDTYWYYAYKQDSKDFKLMSAVVGLESESYDSGEDTMEILKRNIYRLLAESIIKQKKNSVPDDAVERINELYNDEKLKDIPLLDIKYKVSSSSSSSD